MKKRPYGNNLTGDLPKTRIHPEMRENLEHLAVAKQTNVAGVVRLALTDFIHANERETAR